MSFTAWSVVAGETPTAAKWNLLGSNDQSFNDGTGIGAGAIGAASLATSAITLGYASINTSFSTASTTAVQVTNLTSTVTIPSGGRKIRVTAYAPFLYNDTASNRADMGIWDGTVGSGTLIAEGHGGAASGGSSNTVTATAIVTPSVGSKTYNISLKTPNIGTAHIDCNSSYVAYILVEAI